MQSIYNMTREQFVRHVKMIAHFFAVKAHLREHPASTEDVAWAYAAGAWEGFVDRALDCVALLEAHREAEEAAPFN